MIDQVWNFITHQFATNQFFSAAALTSVLMGLAYQLKSVPIRIWSRIERYLTYHVFVAEEDFIMRALDTYIADFHTEKLRHVEVSSIGMDVKSAHDNDFIHIWYKRRRIRISKSREKLENASTNHNRYARSYTVGGILAKKAITDLIETAMNHTKDMDRKKLLEKKEVQIFAVRHGDWDYQGFDPNLKNFNKLHLERKEEIIADLEKFKANEDLYKRMAIPFKRGYLFYGPPGNGKSSLAIAIADYMKYNIYILDISDVTSSAGFMRAFRQIPSHSVVVLEDIDTLYKNRDTEDPDKKAVKVPLSTLLNALSGIGQKQHIITVITTNHIEQLDAALIREGRCDFKMEITNPSKEIVEEYLSTAFEEDIKLKTFKEVPFVRIQEVMISNLTDKDACIKIIEGDMGATPEIQSKQVQKRPPRVVQVKT